MSTVALPLFPAGLLLVLLGGLVLAMPFAARPVPPAVGLRLQRALVWLCAGILLAYAVTVVATVVVVAQ